MHSVRLRIDSARQKTKDFASLIFSITQIFMVRLFYDNDIVKVMLRSGEDADAFYSANIQQKLKSAGITVLKTPQYLASCTLFCRRLSHNLLVKDEKELAEEIASLNSINVPQVKRIGKFPMLKVTCTTQAEAQKLAKSGIKAFNLIIPASDIEFEKFINVRQCYKCYGFGHSTKSCKNDQVCSLCAGSGHSHRQCPENIVKCCNCGGTHTAVSHKCRARAAATDPMTKATTPTPHNPIPTPTTTTRQPLLPTPPIYRHVDTDTDKKITTIIRLSQALAVGDRQYFLQLVQDGLKANNLPTVTIPASYREGEDVVLPPIRVRFPTDDETSMDISTPTDTNTPTTNTSTDTPTPTTTTNTHHAQTNSTPPTNTTATPQNTTKTPTSSNTGTTPKTHTKTPQTTHKNTTHPPHAPSSPKLYPHSPYYSSASAQPETAEKRHVAPVPSPVPPSRVTRSQSLSRN